jgi:hypothetical protein
MTIDISTLRDDELYGLGVRVGEDLSGTCNSQSQMLERYNLSEDVLLNKSFCAGFDTTVECCATCDWWCEPSDLDDDGNCYSCAEDDGD